MLKTYYHKSLDQKIRLSHKTQNSKNNLPQSEHFLQTLNNGFNLFQQIKFPAVLNRKLSRKHTINSSKQDLTNTQIYRTLQVAKVRYEKLRTEVSSLRDTKYNQFITKTIKYQDLLDINESKKRKFKTLNKRVGEVTIKNSNETTKNYLYNASVIPLPIEGWKPQSREGHTSSFFNGNVVIIGGHCSHPFSKINIFCLKDNTWGKPIETGIPRSYHTSVTYKNRYLIVFGGMGIYNQSKKCRECFNSIYLLDLAKNVGKNLKMGNENVVEGRRSHSATILGKRMIVFGGLNTKKQFLSDLLELDLKEFKWNVKEYKIDGLDAHSILIGGLAKHEAVGVFNPNRTQFPIYSPEYEEFEGIYLIGGLNRHGIQNILMQISFSKFVPIIRKINFTGAPPSPIEPLATLHNENMILILSGDQRERSMTVYRIRQKNFINVSCSSTHLFGIGSSIVQHQSNYYLFFGLGEQGYLGTVTSFQITQTVSEQVKKKKNKNLHQAKQNIVYALFQLGNSQASFMQ